MLFSFYIHSSDKNKHVNSMLTGPILTTEPDIYNVEMVLYIES